MKRRDALKSMAALTAALRPAGAAPVQQPAEPPDELTPPAAAQPDEAGEPGRLHFFNPEEMTAFRRLADTLLPRTRTPGALDAGAPEFLDFLLSQSSISRQLLYRQGVQLWMMGRSLDPLRQPWTYDPPDDPWAKFLRAAKEDLWRATVSSRAWAAATEGRRRSTGATYWYPVES
jgi:hypothetical protein